MASLMMGVSSDLEYWKAQFINYWSQSGRGAFPPALKAEYLRMLKEDNPKIQVTSWSAEPERAEYVYDNIIAYDPDLSFFRNFCARFEELSPKSHRFLKLDPLPFGVEKQLREIPVKEDLITNDLNWKIRRVVQNGKTKIVLAKRSFKSSSGAIHKADLDPKVWTSIEGAAKKSLPGTSTLSGVRVSVLADDIAEVGFEFDWDSKTVEIFSDNKDTTIDGGNLKKARDLQIEAAASLATILGVDNADSALPRIVISSQAIDENLHEKIETIKNVDSLVVIRGSKFHVKADSGNNAENIDASLAAFEMSRMELALKNHWKSTHDLTTFLAEYPEFDRRNTKYMSELTELQTDCRGFFVKANSEFKTKKDEKGKIRNEEYAIIDFLSFSYNSNSGEWEIHSKDYSRSIKDAFISEIYSLLKKPGTPPAPPVRNPSSNPIS